MKILEKLTLIIYSYVILIISVLACLLVFGWVDIDLVGEVIKGVIVSSTWGKVILGVSVVFILLSIKRADKRKTRCFIRKRKWKINDF